MLRQTSSDLHRLRVYLRYKGQNRFTAFAVEIYRRLRQIWYLLTFNFQRAHSLNIAYPVPANEQGRVLAVRNLCVLETPAEERFDKITRTAKQVFQVPLALITVIDADRQWFKSVQGTTARGTPRPLAICNFAIIDAKTLIIEDTLRDDRTRDNPVVTIEPKVRFYAGEPLKTPDGYVVGTLCIMDFNPRTLGNQALQVFKDLAGWAEKELHTQILSESQKQLIHELSETQRQIRIDPLTRIWNRRGSMEILEKEINFAKERNESMAVGIIDIDFFKPINDTHGHLTGDEVLIEVTQRIGRVLSPDTVLGRIGGEEFVIIVPACDPGRAKQIADSVCREIRTEPVPTQKKTIRVTISIGMTFVRDENNVFRNASQLLQAADKALYAAKSSGRDRAVIL
jgi:diguanylate cyclase (GGDEF)-like protein